MASTRIKKLVGLCNIAFEQNKITKEAKKKHTEENEKLDALKFQILNILEQEELKTFATDICSVTSVFSESVSFPKDITDKKKVFEYIKTHYDEETLLGYLTIHSAGFNSFYKTESEKAAKEDNFDFRIDGVADAKGYNRLNLRKK